MKRVASLLMIVIALFLFHSLRAQKTEVGIRGGISIPNLTSGGSGQNPLNAGYSSRFGPEAALFVDYRLSELFSIEPMVEYSSQGGKKNGMQAFPTPAEFAGYFPAGMVPPYLYANYKNEAKLNYLMIPVLAKFGWNLKPKSPFRIYIDAGPFAGFLLSAKQVTSGSSNIYADPAGQQALTPGPQSFDATTDIKNQLHAANFGIEGNAGISFQTAKGTIFIEGGGNYGFVNIQKDAADGKNNTGAATAAIGYSLAFGKKK